MTTDEQLVTILLGAILLSRRAAEAIEDLRTSNTGGIRNPQIAASVYRQKPYRTPRIDLSV
jgi:hypothetical protein